MSRPIRIAGVRKRQTRKWAEWSKDCSFIHTPWGTACKIKPKSKYKRIYHKRWTSAFPVRKPYAMYHYNKTVFSP